MRTGDQRASCGFIEGANRKNCELGVQTPSFFLDVGALSITGYWYWALRDWVAWSSPGVAVGGFEFEHGVAEVHLFAQEKRHSPAMAVFQLLGPESQELPAPPEAG